MQALMRQLVELNDQFGYVLLLKQNLNPRLDINLDDSRKFSKLFASRYGIKHLTNSRH